MNDAPPAPRSPQPADRRIRQLDPVVANQIAAGEVVERPSSVVKELIENSLDAGATAITVRLRDGGRTGIQIVDNGHGMGPEDAHLAFARHATSKLVDAAQLMRIGSYGFRGEALASILSVARVTLQTRREQDEIGVQLTGAGSCELTAKPVACAVGTDLRVDDLFFNVPARQKFLRTAATELGHIIRLIDAVALSHPTLRWELTNNGRRITCYEAATDLAERASAVFDSDVAPHLYPVRGDEDYAVDGQLSAPELNRGSASQLIFLVDGRPVKDRTLQHAVVQAYGTLLERRRFPVGVLRLSCPPGTVDVNVHPAKTEVRFVSSQAVHRAVGRAVRAMLAATPWVQRQVLAEPAAAYVASPAAGGAPRPSAAARRSPSLGTHPTYTSPQPSRPGSFASGSPASGLRGSGLPASGLPASHQVAAPGSWPSAQRQNPDPSADQLPAASPLGASSVQPAGERPASIAAGCPVDGAPDAEHAAEVQGGLWGSLRSRRYVGQVGRCFLIFEDGDAMILLDQHAAHERVLFERFVASFRSGGFPSQRMLIPRVVPLGPDAAAALLEQSELTEPLGFELAPAGERAVMVRAFPEVLRPDQIEPEVRRLASSVLDGGRGQATVERLERAAATLACHAAVRAGDVVSAGWVDGLLTSLADVDLAAYCPHGRPALARLTFDQIGRLFDRS